MVIFLLLGTSAQQFTPHELLKESSTSSPQEKTATIGKSSEGVKGEKETKAAKNLLVVPVSLQHDDNNSRKVSGVLQSNQPKDGACLRQDGKEGIELNISSRGNEKRGKDLQEGSSEIYPVPEELRGHQMDQQHGKERCEISQKKEDETRGIKRRLSDNSTENSETSRMEWTSSKEKKIRHNSSTHSTTQLSNPIQQLLTENSSCSVRSGEDGLQGVVLSITDMSQLIDHIPVSPAEIVPVTGASSSEANSLQQTNKVSLPQIVQDTKVTSMTGWSQPAKDVTVSLPEQGQNIVTACTSSGSVVVTTMAGSNVGRKESTALSNATNTSLKLNASVLTQMRSNWNSNFTTSNSFVPVSTSCSQVSAGDQSNTIGDRAASIAPLLAPNSSAVLSSNASATSTNRNNPVPSVNSTQAQDMLGKAVSQPAWSELTEETQNRMMEARKKCFAWWRQYGHFMRKEDQDQAVEHIMNFRLSSFRNLYNRYSILISQAITSYQNEQRENQALPARHNTNCTGNVHSQWLALEQQQRSVAQQENINPAARAMQHNPQASGVTSNSLPRHMPCHTSSQIQNQQSSQIQPSSQLQQRQPVSNTSHLTHYNLQPGLRNQVVHTQQLHQQWHPSQNDPSRQALQLVPNRQVMQSSWSNQHVPHSMYGLFGSQMYRQPYVSQQGDGHKRTAAYAGVCWHCPKATEHYQHKDASPTPAYANPTNSRPPTVYSADKCSFQESGNESFNWV